MSASLFPTSKTVGSSAPGGGGRRSELPCCIAVPDATGPRTERSRNGPPPEGIAMLWEIEIRPRGDAERRRVCDEFNLLTHGQGSPVAASARGYLLEGDLSRDQAERLLNELLLDPLVETGKLGALNEPRGRDCLATVLFKPGVMDPAALSVVEAARDLGIAVESVRTYRRYYGPPPGNARDVLFRKVLCNEAIEQVVEGPLTLDHLAIGTPYTFRLVTVPLRDLDDSALEKLSRDGQLSLSREEMRTIQAHCRTLGRDPTDVELETLAQTWSEHCSHKTLRGTIEFEGDNGEVRRYGNLLKETIFAATQEVRRRLGPDDWCVSVFEDNAGVVRFDDRYHACFKVETHNRPSAIEPYGGASTGIGGVIRDPLGTGLGAKPICNTDVFCFAPPDTAPESLPLGVLHPKKVMKGVIAGVRDYGNRMGIPTVNGAVCFDDRYLANPLVFCGTVGVIPVDRCRKEAMSGDLIVAVGGRTGRDGIHGATFSSAELTHESEKVSGGAVQIGNAITEKMVLDVLLAARDEGLYSAVTDCGAGGFSSAVGEMGAEIGAEVWLERAPLKYEGLSYTEIWISEAQERMVMAVPEGKWPRLEALCNGENVEATVIGRYVPTGKLELKYRGTIVGQLDMHFLHDGRPKVERQATYHPPAPTPHSALRTPDSDFGPILLRLLSSLNIASKEWVIRQYDHEVQGGSVIKPLVGAANDGPSDAAVLRPVLSSRRGLAIACGMNPRYGDYDTYHMAACAIDEAVRNCVAVGADPRRIAILDNFCWGYTDRPETLGALVRAALACYDVAVAYGTPFISGKDSLNNEFSYDAGGQRRTIQIPHTLLISAVGQAADVRRCVTMDLKSPGNLLYQLGATKKELGGSHFELVVQMSPTSGAALATGPSHSVPQVDPPIAKRTFAALHEAMMQGLVRACHDPSEGGLAVAAAEMAFAGGCGARIRLGEIPHDGSVDRRKSDVDAVLLFSESASRFL